MLFQLAIATPARRGSKAQTGQHTHTSQSISTLTRDTSSKQQRGDERRSGSEIVHAGIDSLIQEVLVLRHPKRAARSGRAARRTYLLCCEREREIERHSKRSSNKTRRTGGESSSGLRSVLSRAFVERVYVRFIRPSLARCFSLFSRDVTGLAGDRQPFQGDWC